MLHDDWDDFGKCIRREVVEERLVDEGSGEEHSFEALREIVESDDGAVASFEGPGSRILQCGHVRRIGERLSRCDDCSAERGRSTLVCGRCGVVCAYCGKSVCLRHSQPHADGHRYCKVCVKKGRYLPQPPSVKCSSGGVLGIPLIVSGVFGGVFSVFGRLAKAVLAWW